MFYLIDTSFIHIISRLSITEWSIKNLGKESVHISQSLGICTNKNIYLMEFPIVVQISF